MRCTAKSKQSGEQCKRHATRGRTVCYYHGGATLSGIASPTYRDGRHSKVLPARMRATYDEARRDGQLLELRDEVAVVDARLQDLLTRVDTGESGALWQALHAAYNDLRDAQRIEAPTLRGIEMAKALASIGDLITQGHADYAAWREVGTALEQRRKLVESERKRLIELQQTITAERAMQLMTALLQSVRANVTDRAQLQAIQDSFNRITTYEGNVIEHQSS